MALSKADLKRLMPFSYDEWMLRETARRLQRCEMGKVENNAFLESFAIHARNVAEFFLPKEGKRRKRKGPGAMDFVEGEDWGRATRLKCVRWRSSGSAQKHVERGRSGQAPVPARDVALQV